MRANSLTKKNAAEADGKENDKALIFITGVGIVILGLFLASVAGISFYFYCLMISQSKIIF